MARTNECNPEGLTGQKAREYCILFDWLKEFRREQSVYYLAARLYLTIHLVLGMMIIIGSAIAGSALFTEPNCNSNMITGISALVAGVAGSVNTYLKPSAKAEAFSSARRKVKLVRQDIELIIAVQKWTNRDIYRIHDGLKEFLSEVPSAPKWIWNKVRKRGW